MMAFLSRIGNNLRPSRGWQESCPGGDPIPQRHKCESACCPSHPITDLSDGSIGVISCLTDPDLPHAARLASLGLLPGVVVKLIQAYPAYVVRVGFAEIALDDELANLVRVITGAAPQ
jgi:Fe2+ transport system protein FeoA